MIKRVFDFTVSLICLILFGSLLLICIILASIDTNSFGLFIQSRVGQHGISFKIFKIKTLADHSKEITKFGHFLRKSKLDELPQLFNVLIGEMSFVGPRPDIAGYADLLDGKDRIILKIKPGITGLASLKYRNEAVLLQQQKNPVLYNDTVIWPDKVRINKWYVQNQNLWMDFVILYHTVAPVTFDVEAMMQKKE